MRPFTAATANVNKSLRGPRLHTAVAKATRGVDILAVQEAERLRIVKALHAVPGMTAYLPDGVRRSWRNACPILWRDRFRLLDSGCERIGKGIAKVQPNRVAAWVILADDTGGTVAVISAHTVSGVWRNLARTFARWAGRTRRQESGHELDELAALTGRLGKRADIVVGAGDLNHRAKLHPAVLGAEHAVYAAHPTHGRSWYDLLWLVGAEASDVRAIGSPSDHDVLAATVTPNPVAPTTPRKEQPMRSYNGWPASPDRHAVNIVPLVVDGVAFVPGVRSGDVHTVLGYVAQQFNDRVEPLRDPGCWGWSYRQNRNADNLSCHASGTAIDCNAPQHPNDVEARHNYTARQIREVHQILGEIPELDEVVHWGGDWHSPLTPDPMHFEIHDHDTAKLRRVADRIRNNHQSEEDDMADIRVQVPKNEDGYKDIREDENGEKTYSLATTLSKILWRLNEMDADIEQLKGGK